MDNDNAQKSTSRQALTQELATSLEVLWQLAGEETLTDQEIAERTGLKYTTLRNWLHRNKKVIRAVDGQDQKEGLRDIRTRAKSTTKSSYLQRLYGLMIKAETAGDLRTAVETLKWLLEKQFPLQFGNQLKVSGRLDTGRDIESLTDEQLEKEIQKNIAELMKRPECQDFLKKQQLFSGISNGA